MLQKSDENPTGAFWEIFAKRVNESVHLLEGGTMLQVLHAFDSRSDRPDLTSGICHFICQELERLKDVSDKFKSFQDLLETMAYLNANSVKLSSRSFVNVINGFSRLVYQVDNVNHVVQIAEAVSKLRPAGHPLSKQEKVLLKSLMTRAHISGDAINSFEDLSSKLGSN
jgi:hypothetical protein